MHQEPAYVLVLAPHEGWIDSDTWLKCRKKCLNVRQIAKPVKAKNTWLAGKIKCRRCGYALSLRNYKRKKSDDARYYVCARKYVAMDCDGVGAIPADKVEDVVFLEMQDKLKEFSSLQMHEKPESTIQITKLKVRVTQIEKEIDTLVEKVLRISGYLEKWDSIDLSDKITLVDALIDSVRVDEEHIDIIWKI